MMTDRSSLWGHRRTGDGVLGGAAGRVVPGVRV